MIIKLLDARIGKVWRVDRSDFIDTNTHGSGEIALRCDVPGLKKSSVREENVNVSERRINYVNGAARVDGNPGSVAQARIFKREQRSALRFKLVDVIDGRIDKKDIAQRIG